MAASFRSAGTWAFTSNNAPASPSLSPGAPAGKAVGDLLILITESRGISGTPTTPSGWNLAGSVKSTTTSGGSIYVYTRIADGTAADTPTVSWSGLTSGTTGDGTGAGILCYQNAAETVDVAAVKTDLSAQTTTSTITGLTTLTAGDIVLMVAMKIIDSSAAQSVASPYTERVDAATTSGTGHMLEIADQIKTPAGAAGSATVTWGTTTSARVLGLTIAIQQAQPVITPSNNIAATSTMGGAVTGPRNIRPAANINATSQVSCGVSGTITFVQEIITGSYDNAGTPQTTHTFPIPSGHGCSDGTMIVCLCASDQQVTSVTDSQGNTWAGTSVQPSSGDLWLSVFYTFQDVGLLTVGSTFVTHYAAGQTLTAAFFVEFGGMASSPVDQNATQMEHSVAHKVGPSVTTTQGAEVVFGLFGYKSIETVPTTPDSGWSLFPSDTVESISNNISLSAVYQIVSSVGSYSPGVTGSFAPTNINEMTASFKGSFVPGIVIIPPSGGTTKSITPTTNISATSSMSGAVHPLRPILPATISATSTVSGNLRVLRAVIAASIAATSTVSASVIVRRAVRPTTNISATSTVSGRVNKLAAIAGLVSATSTVTGRVNKLAAISGAIAATSTVSGQVQKLRPITPTTSISATSTVSGRVNKLARIGGNVAATSTVSGSVVAQRRITPTTISATSTVTGRVNKLAAISGAIAATSTVTSSIRVIRAIRPTTNISATSTVTGNLAALRRISPATISATSTVSGNITRIPAGKFITPTSNISATSTVTGSVSVLRKIAGAVSATSTVSGSLRVTRGVLPASILATSTVTSKVTALRKIAGSVAATSTVAGSLIVRRAIRPTTNISATSTVTGLVTRLGTDPIIPLSAISATSTVTGRVTAIHRIGGAISATSTVTGNIRVIRAIKPVSISATSTVAGTVTRLRHFTGSIFASSTVTGSIRVRRAVFGNIVATSTMAGSLKMQRRITVSQISATSTVAGAIITITPPVAFRGFTPRILGTVSEMPIIERVRT